MERYYVDIPIGKENAVTYQQLMAKWNCSHRKVRDILHELSGFDNGDGYILIRSSHGKGFYLTDNQTEIEKYRKECYNRAVHTFAPFKKINRILGNLDGQMVIDLGSETY